MFLGIHASSQIALSVEFAMLAVVTFGACGKLEQVVRVHLLASNFIILIRLLLVFIVHFGFDIEERTLAAMRALAPLCIETSAERIGDEVVKMLTEGKRKSGGRK